MSEQTYTHIVQAVVLVIFVLGLMYADPAAPAFAQPAVKRDDRHVNACVSPLDLHGGPCEAGALATNGRYEQQRLTRRLAAKDGLH